MHTKDTNHQKTQAIKKQQQQQKQQAINFLRLRPKVDAMAAWEQTAVTMSKGNLWPVS